MAKNNLFDFPKDFKSVDYSPSAKKRYYFITGDYHKLIFSSQKISRDFILKTIKHYPGSKWGLLRFLIRSGLYKNVKSSKMGFVYFDYDPKMNFPGEAMLIDQRRKVFDLKNKKVYYFLYKNQKDQISHEKELRKKYKEINFPAIIFKKDVFITDFLDLKFFSKAEALPNQVLEKAIHQLCYFYKKNKIQKSTFSKEIIKIKKDNKDFSLLDKEDAKVLNHAMQVIQSEKQVMLTKVHGDFHLSHIGMQEDKVYILDWELARIENILFDLFWFFINDFRLNKTEFIKKASKKKLLYYPDFRRTLERFERELKLDFDEKELFTYLVLTMLRLIERAYKERKLDNVKNQIKLLNILLKWQKLKKY